MSFFTLSSGGQVCGLCNPWEDVLATDGPALVDGPTRYTCADIEGAGVFHNGCKHSWIAVKDTKQFKKDVAARIDTLTAYTRAVQRTEALTKQVSSAGRKLKKIQAESLKPKPTVDAKKLSRQAKKASAEAQYGVDGASALSDYQGASADFNKWLRAGANKRREHALNAHFEKRLMNMDKAFARAEILQEDLTVYRGMTRRSFSQIDDRAPGGIKFRPGASFKDKSYVSTTTDKGVAQQFAGYYGPRKNWVEIRIPKGTRVSHLDANFLELDCAEVLLNRNAAFRYVGRNAEGRPILELIT